MPEPKLTPDRQQMTRWVRLLGSDVDAAVPDIIALAATLRTAAGRPLLVAAVTAVTAVTAAAIADEAVAARLRPAVAGLNLTPLRRPAAAGVAACDAVWRAYLGWRLGDPVAGPWLRSAVLTLDPTALVFTADDNPEPWWQSEMVILHALHSFALRSRDPDLLARTLACTDFHLREIQPDHATNEPWAVHAYASHPDGNVTAETLLHAGFIQHGGRLGPVARRVAADAAAALAVYLGA